MRINVISTGSHTTDDILTNEDLSKIVDTNDEWIVERTGIKKRHISKKMTTEELAYEACKKALNKIDIDKNDIGLIIFASVSSDTTVPSSSFTISGMLGIENAVCFDLNAACSGFIYSLSVARDVMTGMRKKYAIVIGAEKLTKHVDWEDRSTCVLFGDAAGCAILENTDEVNPITLPHKRLNIVDTLLGGKYDSKKYLSIKSNDSVTDDEPDYIKMNGRQIYKFATDIGVKIIDELLDKAKITKDEIELIVPHQANKRIIDTISNKSNIPIDKWFVNLHEYGNTSSASVPLALDEALEELEKKENVNDQDRYVLTFAFGGGLSYGGVLLKIVK
ncbi:beta-ketoacyl-ACP synthase III [Peptostreptococcus faecalis]|uniref:beta-ketoacyl-ACP synthase III n=1 Tax=Peptostreptococcus faecalis TaxID=2045015 RepID=UPI000C7A5509|nr:beta-ketoacyl-ACP synthase III [Peptostreptococcus faecalis]